jgi:predicted Fe-Mo cluster-binding NifX family protein
MAVRGIRMRIAVTSQNFKTITGHAGKSRRFLVFEVDAAGEPREVQRLDLPMGMSMHDDHRDDHPLLTLGLDALITQGAGQGFVARMGRVGAKVHTTSLSDPLVAARALARGEPLPAAESEHH